MMKVTGSTSGFWQGLMFRDEVNEYKTETCTIEVRQNKDGSIDLHMTSTTFDVHKRTYSREVFHQFGAEEWKAICHLFAVTVRQGA